jgi:hypothetical protein
MSHEKMMARFVALDLVFSLKEFGLGIYYLIAHFMAFDCQFFS